MSSKKDTDNVQSRPFNESVNPNVRKAQASVTPMSQYSVTPLKKSINPEKLSSSETLPPPPPSKK